MSHQEELDKQEEILQAIADTKSVDELYDMSDASACDEDMDCLLEPLLDGIYAALALDKHDKKQVYVIRTNKQEDVDSGCGSYVIFISDNFEKLKNEIEALSPREE